MLSLNPPDAECEWRIEKRRQSSIKSLRRSNLWETGYTGCLAGPGIYHHNVQSLSPDLPTARSTYPPVLEIRDRSTFEPSR